MKIIKRSIAALLSMTMCLTVFSFPVSASTSIDLDEMKQQIEYYEDVGDYDAVEKIVDETLPELFPNTTIQTRALDYQIVLDILAAYGIGYGGGYAVGEFCKNHDIPYAAGLAALLAAASVTGGILPNPMKVVLTLGYDNGYNS